MISCTSIAAQRHLQVFKRRSRAEQVFKDRASVQAKIKSRAGNQRIVTSIKSGTVKVGKEGLVMWFVEATVHALSELRTCRVPCQPLISQLIEDTLSMLARLPFLKVLQPTGMSIGQDVAQNMHKAPVAQ